MGAMIEVRDLVKNFGEFCAVDRISFTVPEGAIFAFLGPNGAGKTTTIKMLTTVLNPSSGNLLVDGRDPRHEQRQVRRSFGIVFQDPSLDDELTALENMELHGVLYSVPSSERREKIATLLKFVELGPPQRLCEDLFGRHEAASRNCARLAAQSQNPLSR